MKKNVWIKVTALVIVFVVLAISGVYEVEPAVERPSDYELIGTFVAEAYRSEFEFKIFEEYTNETHIFYEAYDSDGYGIAGGFVNREDLIRDLY